MPLDQGSIGHLNRNRRVTVTDCCLFSMHQGNGKDYESENDVDSPVPLLFLPESTRSCTGNFQMHFAIRHLKVKYMLTAFPVCPKQLSRRSAASQSCSYSNAENNSIDARRSWGPNRN